MGKDETLLWGDFYFLHCIIQKQAIMLGILRTLEPTEMIGDIEGFNLKSIQATMLGTLIFPTLTVLL